MVTRELDDLLFRVRPDDVIASVLFWLPETFKANKEVFHTTVTQMAEEHPDLFGAFEVTSDYPYPFSRRLENVLNRLGQSQLLSILNPAFSTYCVDAESKATIEARHLKKFSAEQKQVLRDVADALAERLST